MGYYDWGKIVQKYGDNELKRIYLEENREPKDKVDAAIDELIKRGLLSSDKKELRAPKEEDLVLDIGAVRGKTKPNRKQANIAILAIGMVLLLFIASMISSIMQYELLTSVKKGIVVTEEVAINNDNREMIVGTVSIIAYIISSILFLVWFYRAYENLSHRVNKVDHSKSWSIWAWFVPFISLYRPYNIMNELNKKTDLILGQRGITLGQGKNSPIALWWGLFIVSVYIGKVFEKLGALADTIDGLILVTISGIFILTVGIVLAFVTILVIKDFAGKEELLYETENNTARNKSYA